MPSSAADTVIGWSVRCAACGSCCNSAPVLSLPELFRHQDLFVGALGMRRVRRIRVGDSLGRGRATSRASEEDRGAYERIAAGCLHPIPGEDGDGHDLLLTPLAFDDPGLGRCPALGPDARCTIHGQQKPIVCSAIPFDALMPDRLQHVVLAERWGESDDLGARCIARARDSELTTVLGPAVDEDVRHVLDAGRHAMAMDKRYWGEALFARLSQQVLAEPGGADRIPTDGFIVIPLALVLELLAGISERCRERCLDYLDAQMVLCQVTANACLARKQPSAGASVARLRAFLRSYRALRGVLLSRRVEPAALSAVIASEIESWLEQDPPSAGALA